MLKQFSPICVVVVVCKCKCMFPQISETKVMNLAQPTLATFIGSSWCKFNFKVILGPVCILTGSCLIKAKCPQKIRMQLINQVPFGHCDH